MARSSERLTADAYTRASVEEYLRAVAEERTRLELAIAEQQRRRDAAVRFLERLESVGRVPVVEAHGPAGPAVPATAPSHAPEPHEPVAAPPSVPVGSGE